MTTVLYAPIVYSWDTRFWPPSLGETEYYEWQVKVWKTFAEMVDINFIWSVVDSRTNNLIDPISLMKAKNIRYSVGKLGKELKRCDFLIVDYPSTAMLDARKARKPSHCLMIVDHDFLRKDYLNNPNWGDEKFFVKKQHLLNAIERKF